MLQSNRFGHGWILLLSLAGCHAGAEIGWTLGPLPEILPLQARMDGDLLRLRVALVGWDGRPLGPEDRIRTTTGNLRLRTLDPASATFDGELQTQDGGATLKATARELVHRPEAAPGRLIVLLDNSTAAAAADPGLGRVAGARAVIDGVACREGCALGPAEVGLLSMQQGKVVTIADPSRDGQALNTSLQRLGDEIGGEAPLWDGLLAATRAGAAAVLCYTASGLAGPSTVTPANVAGALSGQPAIRLVAVQQLGQSADLIDAASRSGGLWLGVGPGGLEPTLRAAAAGLRGSWELVWKVSSVARAERLVGTLDLGLGPDRRTTELELPLLH